MTATLLQLALHAHPEAYGGPVVDLRGQVVGVLVPRYPAPGSTPGSGVPAVEFALPAALARTVAGSMLQAAEVLHKRTTRSPWLGCSVLELAALGARLRRQDPQALRALQEVAPPYGVYVDDVFTPSPAAAAGIAAGDFLLSIDGQRLGTVYDFQRQLYLAGVGAEVTLEVQRGAARRDVRAEVAARPARAVPR